MNESNLLQTTSSKRDERVEPFQIQNESCVLCGKVKNEKSYDIGVMGYGVGGGMDERKWGWRGDGRT